MEKREKGKRPVLTAVDMLEKENKWAKDQAEREAVLKEVAEKKTEIKFIDADISTKRNILKELEEREA